jgi:3-oxoacyl-[acyl-carrier protein] reductase
MLLQDKVAIVTGAGRGIGSTIARMFAAEGAKVVVHYNKSRLPAEDLAQEIRNGIAMGADLADPIASKRLIEQAVKVYGRVDILVNNAASFAHDIHFQESTWADYEKEFAGVVGATFNPTNAVVPYMIEQGSGRIINFIATLLQRPAIEHIVHTTAKSALLGFSRTLSRELGPHGITVNMVSPGMTMTDYANELPEDVKNKVLNQTPLRRLATAEDVAKIVLFYASPLADFVTAANITPDGGLAIL